MEIRKLYKPQRMGNLENVIAYSGEEENPDESADAKAVANADSTSTDSTDVVMSEGVAQTDKGFDQTVRVGDGRVTFQLNSPVYIKDGGDDVDTLVINFSGGIGGPIGVGAGIEIAIPLPEGNESGGRGQMSRRRRRGN